ncbi:uncharacterized protein At1g76070 [Elaeis guineensis]|uniref:Uncharacterized protein At1g76070 n=1 Tax=Elaeis guineensis var. tenera TaxID=51953 RepID=A0A6I9S0L9_ELAGV|nr:uncharacterized protein At1g76070 [Elaeis guineensis]
MEKPTRAKATKIFSFLPKPTSFSIPHPPAYSPGRENPAKSKALHKTFSGPIISIIPVEARRKEKNGGGFDAQEPTSPKVSCIGQVKHKKPCRPKRSSPPRQERKPANFIIRKMFQRKARPGRRMDAAESSEGRPAVVGRAPSLGQMQRFTSGRETLRDFDWRKVEMKQEAATGDPEKCPSSDEESDEEHDVAIYHSAPLMVGGGVVGMEPRKEVNLWKRRTLAPPAPLQFK